MTFVEILVEGASDVPVVREVLMRRLGRLENEHFRVHAHRGKGRRPRDPRAHPTPSRRGLLDQLPARLRAYQKMSRAMDLGVVVLVDVDGEDCLELKRYLLSLEPRPSRTSFRIAVEELESWFLADRDAIRRAFPSALLDRIPDGPPDRVIGAWECLAQVLRRDPATVTGVEKAEWAQAIAPHLNLDAPPSPSLRTFIEGVGRMLDAPSP